MPLPAAPKNPASILDESAYGDRTGATSARRTPKKTKAKAQAKTETKTEIRTDAAVAVTPEVKVEAKAETKASEVKKTRAKKAAKAAKSEIQAQVEAIEKADEDGENSPGRLRRPRTITSVNKPRIFALDTNVLLHDPVSLFRFAEHDVFLPMMTLEELDNHKTGTSDIARNARQVSRSIDQLIDSQDGPIDGGIALNALGNKDAQGKLFFQTESMRMKLPEGLPEGKADNLILATVAALQEKYPDKNVVLVSKDINMRIKATALGLPAEDYFNDKTIDDTDLLPIGHTVLAETFWEEHSKSLESWQADGRTWYRIHGPLVHRLSVNEFVSTPDGSFAAQVKSKDADSVTLSTFTDYMQPRNAVWGIHARNLEQSMALNLLMDPEIDFVTLLGQAGTGKTLLTLAAALSMTLDMRKFTEIIFTRATVSVGEEIGFLPGTEEEKMQPWMGALEDNLEVLNKSDKSTGDWGRNAANDLIRSRIRIKSMSFMRGRTFLNKLVIIDEAQNLSPKQMKTLITRAGPGSKIICLGNIAQIDTPYLTEGSSGLTYVVDRFKGWAHAGHITLQRGERSRLADFATEVL